MQLRAAPFHRLSTLVVTILSVLGSLASDSYAQHATMLWRANLHATDADISADGSRIVISRRSPVSLALGSNTVHLNAYDELRTLNASTGSIRDSLVFPGLGLHQPFFDAEGNVVIYLTTSKSTVDSTALCRIPITGPWRKASVTLIDIPFNGQSNLSQTVVMPVFSDDRSRWILSISEYNESTWMPSSWTQGTLCSNTPGSDSLIVHSSEFNSRSLALSNSGHLACSYFSYHKPYHYDISETKLKTVIVDRRDSVLYLADGVDTEIHDFCSDNSCLIMKDSLYHLNQKRCLVRVNHTQNLRWLNNHFALCIDSSAVCLVDVLADSVVARFQTPDRAAPTHLECSASKHRFVVQYLDSSTAVWDLDVSNVAPLRGWIVEAKKSHDTVDCFQQITFNAKIYPYDSTTTVEWDFGDGTTSSGLSIVHWYEKAGTYSTTLRVRSNAALVDTLRLARPTVVVPYSQECQSVFATHRTAICDIIWSPRDNAYAYCNLDGILALNSLKGAELSAVNLSTSGIRALINGKESGSFRFGAFDAGRNAVRLCEYNFNTQRTDTLSTCGIAHVSRIQEYFISDVRWNTNEYVSKIVIAASGNAMAVANTNRVSATINYQGKTDYRSKWYGGYYYATVAEGKKITNAPDSELVRDQILEEGQKLVPLIDCALSAREDKVAFLSQPQIGTSTVRSLDVYDCASSARIYSVPDTTTNSIIFSQDGDEIIGNQRVLRLPDLTTRTLHMPSNAYSKQLPRNPRYLLCFAPRKDSCLWLYDYVADTLVHMYGHSCDVPSCATFSPDLRTIIVGCQTGTHQLWNLPDQFYNVLSLPADDPKSAPKRLEPIVEIYPNPSSSNCIVKLTNQGPGASELRLINLLGTVLHSETLVNDSSTTVTLDISTSDLPTGFYFVELRGSASSIMKALSVVHF